MAVALLWSMDVSAAPVTVSTCLDYTPFEYDGRGEKVWNGRNIEVLHLVVERLGYQLDASTRAPFARCMKLLELGQIDVIAGLIYTKERSKKFELMPYGNTQQLAVFYAKSRYPNFSIDTLQEKDLIGVHRAFALPKEVQDSNVINHITPVTSVAVGFEMAFKGRLVGVLASVGTGNGILFDWPEMQGEFAMELVTGTGNAPVHFAIHRSSSLVQDKARIARILTELAEDSNYQHLNL